MPAMVYWRRAVITMPTVLDFLRRQLLGDEGADKLELCLDIINARVFDGWQQKIPAQANDSLCVPKISFCCNCDEVHREPAEK